jgi:hypothetical protein
MTTTFRFRISVAMQDHFELFREGVELMFASDEFSGCPSTRTCMRALERQRPDLWALLPRIHDVMNGIDFVSVRGCAFESMGIVSSTLDHSGFRSLRE